MPNLLPMIIITRSDSSFIFVFPLAPNVGDKSRRGRTVHRSDTDKYEIHTRLFIEEHIEYQG